MKGEVGVDRGLAGRHGPIDRLQTLRHLSKVAVRALLRRDADRLDLHR